MTPGEKGLSVLALFMPALNRLAMLGSFGLAIKLILASATGKIEPEWRWAIALTLAATFALSSLIRWTGDKVFIALHTTSLRIVRRLIANNLLGARELMKKERGKVARNFRKVEARLVRKWSTILVNIVDLAASGVMIAILMTLVTWVLPLVGGLMMSGGILVLLYFCFRIKKSKGNPPLREAQMDLDKLVKRLVGGKGQSQNVVKSYENNRVDRIRSSDFRKPRELKSKLSWLVSGGAAVMMVSVFYLASDGWLDGKDPVLLILFAFALRFSIFQSENVFFKWTLLLRERDAARLLSRVLQGDKGYLGSGSFTINADSEEGGLDQNETI